MSAIPAPGESARTATTESMWFAMGSWAFDTSVIERQSVDGQVDAVGRIFTDTFVARPAPPGGQPTGYRLRVTLHGTDAATPVDRQLAEQRLGHEVVAARRGPGGPEVATAHVRGDRHPPGPAADRVVDLLDVSQMQVLGVLAAPNPAPGVTGMTRCALSTTMPSAVRAMACTRAAPPGLFRNCQDGLTWKGRSARKSVTERGEDVAFRTR